ncbi:hypothetical protein Q5M85_12645 [Paraclostridium bifermentans]|nr:hypothetical protein [Paraclostridium bifermentans]
MKEEEIDIKLDELDDFVQYKARGQNTKSYLKEKYKDKIDILKIVKIGYVILKTWNILI